MEIRSNNPLNSQPKEGLNFDPTRPSRESLEKFSPEPITELPVKDEVKVSSAAQEALAREQRVESRSEQQEQKLEELRALHQRGALNSPDRAEQAANRMLLGE